MSSNDNASQQVKGVVDNSNRVRDGSSVINNGSNESQIIHQKSDEQILLASHQQQQQQFYHPHHQGAPAAHQQYTMYPSGVTYSIDPTQGGTNPGGLDYTMIQPQQIYQVPVYFSSETYHPQHGYEDPYQTSSSTQFQAAAAVGGGGGPAAAVPSQYHHHIQTAQYSGGGGEHLQPQHHPQQQTYMQQENNSQGIYPKPNATMFDNTAAKYTADWVSRTTLIPSEMKVPPDQAVDLVSHDSKVITPKNWGEGSYVVTTSNSSKPIASATVDQQQPLLDQQLAQLDITSFPFVSSQLSQPQQQQGVLGGGYAMNWPGTSQQQPQQQQQIYRDQRAYNATGGAQKPQATSWADITRKGTNNNNNNIVYQQQQQQQQRPQYGGNNSNFQDQRGTQSAQPTGQSQIRHERSFTGPKNTFNQTGANNPGSFVRNVNRSSGNFGNNRGAGNNMSRGNNRSGGPPRQPQHNPSYSAPPQQQQFQPQQQRGPLPSLLAQHRTQNFPRNNFGGQQQRPQGNNTFGFAAFGGGPNQHHQSHQQQHQQQMPEFNPGVPPPALPNQFRQPIPPMMPPFPPPPFNMMNPQQQQQFFRAFISNVRPDAMMPPGPYGFDQFGQRFFNPGYPFGHHPGAGGGPPFGGQQFNNRFPNFNRGPRRGRGGGGRFQQPRRNFQDQSRYNNSNSSTQQSQQQQQSSPQDSANPKQLDPELADSVNRGVEFDRDETKTPEPKGDTETTGSPNEDKKDSPKDDDDVGEDEKDTSSSSSSTSSPTNANPTTTTTKTAETTT